MLADFNHDGRSDVFVADHGDDQSPFPGFQNTVILSAPGGTLANATANLPQASDFTHSGAAGDVNGDGATDLYVGNVWGGNHVPPRILVNDGSGHFAVGDGLLPATQTDVNSRTYTSSLFADVNGDGKQDLILGADNSTPDSVVLLNDGTGHFSLLPAALPPKPFGTDALAYDIATEDINGDGRADLLMAFTRAIPPGQPTGTGSWVQVLIGNGDGTFRDETSARLPQSDNNDPWATFLEQHDLNRDGRLDFGLRVGGGAGGSPLLYLLDPAAGVFQLGPAVNVGNQLWTFADAEGDGSNDTVAANPSNGAVSLFRENRSSPPPPPLPPAHDTTPPVLSVLTVHPATFRVSKSRLRPRAKLGTTISYSASESVTAIFTVDRALPGVKRGGRCVAPRPGRARSARCTRFVPLPGSFSDVDAAGGSHRFRYTGRLQGNPLRLGAYRLDATAKDAAGNLGNVVRAHFRVVRN